MGLRFRKSFKIVPGVRLNLNRKSVGVSLGGKGARYSINSSGRRTATVSVPGTGISYSKTTAGKSSSGKSAPGTSERYRGKSVKNSAVSGGGKKKKSSWWKWAIAVIIICGLIGACFGDDQNTTSEETSTAIETESVMETPSVTEESSALAGTETATETEVESTPESVSEEESEPEVPESTETQATVSPAASAVSDPVQNETPTMVWIPSSGTKYHSINNCGNMNPEKATQISLDEAISRGIPPCSKCW